VLNILGDEHHCCRPSTNSGEVSPVPPSDSDLRPCAWGKTVGNQFHCVASANGPFLVLFFQVVDPATGEPLGSGKNGEIWIKSALVMIGYAGNPAATAAIIDDNGWLHTGNL